jgi:hypothetical protein
MLFILVLLITSLVNLLFTDNGIGGSITLLGNLLLAYLFILLVDKKITIWILLAYSITIGFISYHVFILNTHPNFIYEDLSRNHAGFVIVFWTVFLLFYLKIIYNIFPLIFPLIGLVLSFYLYGRTSLIVSALLVILVVFYKYRANKKAQILLLMLFAVVGYYQYINFGEILAVRTNLGAGLDTPRWELWEIYFQHINFLNLFTGVDVNTLPRYDYFSGNPHNSFLKFHSRIGVGSILFIFTLLFSFYIYLRTKQYYIFTILFLLTLRALFDSDILIGSFDFIFLIIMFYWIKDK